MYFFTKFTYNEYIGPYFLSHVVLQFLPSDLPEDAQSSIYISISLYKVCASHDYFFKTHNYERAMLNNVMNVNSEVSRFFITFIFSI
jgi:hypothetical protein